MVAIVKNFDRIAANRVNVSMLNEDYAEKDLEKFYVYQTLTVISNFVSLLAQMQTILEQ